MKKGFILLILCVSAQLKAQDRILTLKRDTLLAKITSIDKQKVSFFLEADKEKKIISNPITDIHKVIWRNGLEFIVNKELDEKLKKDLLSKAPSTVLKPKQEKSFVEEEKKSQSKYQFSDAPAVGYRRIFGRHKVNGKIKKAKEVLSIFKKYDLETYNRFYDVQLELKKYERLMIIGGAIVSFVPILGYNNLESTATIFNTVGFGIQLIGVVKFYKTKKISREVIDDYNLKRENRQLSPVRPNMNR